MMKFRILQKRKKINTDRFLNKDSKTYFLKKNKKKNENKKGLGRRKNLYKKKTVMSVLNTIVFVLTTFLTPNCTKMEKR